ncbi:hypothetical protein [Kosakonia oryzae]|uniref:Uncharacterized protein n=1 Tax=Kosakonia oryzae TaxID=497725 RepID=A0AA94KPF8_9ENTR|nr:hypothetical protein [Kosakonia oryzae]QSV12308.1 hypothetical protein AWR26_24955 [Kosakonia oryzae]SFC11846.1 hypothetical protein SAMN05216286_1659 [Kosakonia oryzae]
MKKFNALLSILLFGLSMNIAAAPPERSSEPDWNEVCHILCLAGEGGAACNCDLIP